jgi:hypothetical protein
MKSCSLYEFHVNEWHTIGTHVARKLDIFKLGRGLRTEASNCLLDIYVSIFYRDLYLGCIRTA